MIGTRKAGNIAAEALYWANARALFSLAKCANCDRTEEQAGSMFFDSVLSEHFCGQCSDLYN